jgi:tRNA(Ile)-lysidine synthase TilS/MesJ
MPVIERSRPSAGARHILALSGGKDSAALAVYMREKYPDLPLVSVLNVLPS